MDIDLGGADALPDSPDAGGDARIGGDAAPPPPDATLEDAARPPVDAQPPDAAPPPPCRPGQARDCGVTRGRCRAGTQRCGADAVWGPCEGEIGPEDEVCNVADDDCNGVVDDGFDVGGPCEGVGACGAGVVECRSPFLTRCSTDPGGSRDESGPERCNEVDDDCDGSVDEDFRVGGDCVGECGPGELECAPEEALQCSTDPGGSHHAARPEVCNGRDDDCNGTVDDGFGLGEACDGVGACGAGTHECDGAGGVQCSTDASGSESEAVDEACNALDDDCDGDVDEGFAVDAPCEGEGACGAGVTECSPQGAIRCSTDPGGSASEVGVELCNRLDDDCDGEVDEGLGVGEACPAQGICAAGRLECGPRGGVVCDTRPGGSRDQSRVETCDGTDDDCDGQVDEGFGRAAPCDGVGACGAGVGECDDEGGGRCSTDPGGSADQSGAEICDGVDNDCNRFVDDGDACGGDTCQTAPSLGIDFTAGGDSGGLANDYIRSTCVGDSGGPDQVFRFAVPGAGNYVVGVAPLAAGFDPLFWVTGDCGQPQNCLDAQAGRGANGAGRPEARVVPFPRGGDFFVVVDTREPAGGPFVVTVRSLAEGESCATPIALPLPGRFVSTTEGARRNDVAGNRCPQGSLTVGPDMVFQVEAPRAGRLTARVTPGPANVDVVVYVVRECLDIDGTCVGGINATGAGLPETLAVNVDAGTYTVVVDHVANLGGPFLLEVSLE